ncbi:hypothetical protein KCU85_g4993, partial [Aureobasidium melanogenum]
MGGKPTKYQGPAIRFPSQEVELRYNVGTRTNGVDLPYWLKDLSVVVVDKDSIQIRPQAVSDRVDMSRDAWEPHQTV